MAQHVSVLLERCIELLSPAIDKVENPVVVDATLGLGGHTEALLRKFPNLIVIGIDRDEDAIGHATSRLEVFGDRFKGVHAMYDQIQECIEKFGYKKVDGILFDLGVSSMQLDEVDRGFSYANDAPLDMRMDRSQGRTAADIINFAGRDELIMILRKYGEERRDSLLVLSMQSSEDGQFHIWIRRRNWPHWLRRIFQLPPVVLAAILRSEHFRR